jgi:hypothetical protein
MPVTSINMHHRTRSAVHRAAIRLGKSRRDIIVNLLMRAMERAGEYQRTFTTVKYQADDPNGDWRPFCIRFKGAEYEFFTDFRKFCKNSVSLFVAIAVKEYLPGLIAEHERGIYNYCSYREYLVAQGSTGRIHCWLSCWGRRQGPRETKPPRFGYAGPSVLHADSQINFRILSLPGP